jgi:hypothetical protein
MWVRTDINGNAHKLFSAIGLKSPPKVLRLTKSENVVAQTWRVPVTLYFDWILFFLLSKSGLNMVPRLRGDDAWIPDHQTCAWPWVWNDKNNVPRWRGSGGGFTNFRVIPVPHTRDKLRPAMVPFRV